MKIHLFSILSGVISFILLLLRFFSLEKQNKQNKESLSAFRNRQKIELEVDKKADGDIRQRLHMWKNDSD